MNAKAWSPFHRTSAPPRMPSAVGWIRWLKGFMQTCITHSRQPLVALSQLGAGAAFALVTMILGTVISALGYPFFIGLMALGFADGALLRPGSFFELASSSVSLVLFGAGLAAILLPALAAIPEAAA